MYKEKLIRLPFVAKMLQKMYCGYSTCGICGLPWPVCGMESIDINEYLGVFYVCPHCFKTKPLEEVIDASAKGYYMQYNSIKDKKSRMNFLETHDLKEILDKIRLHYMETHNSNIQM